MNCIYIYYSIYILYTFIYRSHKVAAPILSSKQEVSGYVEYNITDISPQTSWVVEIDSLEDNTAEYWIARKSHIKLIHVNTSAALSVSQESLSFYGSNLHYVGQVGTTSNLYHEPATMIGSVDLMLYWPILFKVKQFRG